MLFRSDPDLNMQQHVSNVTLGSPDLVKHYGELMSNSSAYVNCVVYNAQDESSEFIASRSVIPSYEEQRVRDLEDGIYHLNLGSDRGLVKSIDFNRIDQPYQRESRMARAGEMSTLEQIRERYNAKVTLYGNSYFLPGQFVFINPSMVGLRSVANLDSITSKLGLGGYFMVITVESIIEEGNYETILDCSWQSSGFSVPGGESTSRSCAAPGGDPLVSVDIGHFDWNAGVPSRRRTEEESTRRGYGRSAGTSFSGTTDKVYH